MSVPAHVLGGLASVAAADRRREIRERNRAERAAAFREQLLAAVNEPTPRPAPAPAAQLSDDEFFASIEQDHHNDLAEWRVRQALLGAVLED